jgi:hypothetical protein
MGKGDHRRPAKVSREEFSDNWDKIFSNRGRGNPAQVRAIAEEYRRTVHGSRDDTEKEQAKSG